MVSLSWTAHTGYLLWEPQQNATKPDFTEATPLDHIQDTNVKVGTDKVISNHSLIFTGIAAQVIMTHTEATPGHDIGIIAAIPRVAHNAHVPYIEITVIDPTRTHHTDLIADHPHIEVPQLTTPEIIVDHVHIHPTNPQDKFHIGHTHTPADHKAHHTTRRT